MSWNARVRCIKSESDKLTLGKIYAIKDGSFADDDGHVFGKSIPLEDIDCLNLRLVSKFELVEENTDSNVRNMAKSTDNKQVYWNNICKMQQRQTEKGLSKYGQILEDNITMDMKTRLEYLQEELIDGLMYIEHIKTLLGIGGIES